MVGIVTPKLTKIHHTHKKYIVWLAAGGIYNIALLMCFGFGLVGIWIFWEWLITSVKHTIFGLFLLRKC